jgi:hypothetical protein
LEGGFRPPDPKDFNVSRIWDELKKAEKQRSQSPGSQPAGQLQDARVANRKTKRSQPHVPLFVYGADVDTHPFHEESETINASEGGCLILLEAPVARGQHLYIINVSNQAERECRITRVGNPVRGKKEVALEFVHPAPAFWFDS